jgi:hypothetical protein
MNPDPLDRAERLDAKYEMIGSADSLQVEKFDSQMTES